MPAIPSEALDSVIYLYPDAESAASGERAGGCGFVVGIASEHSGLTFAYVVTNSHVIREGKSPVVRVNTRDGKFQIINAENQHWIIHPDGDDIAILPINFEYESIKVKGIGQEFFATKEKIEQFKVGPGDEVFIPGRFVFHEGKECNRPAVRFGHISVLPYERVPTERGLLQEAFLIECSSIPGNSGSPVFLLTAPFTRVVRPMPPPMLLGILEGHMSYFKPIVDRTTGRAADSNWGVETDTGLSTVIPAWKLRELLYSEEPVTIRARMERQIADAKKSAP
jgi:hypothetical protein